jgi:hypothetical protein
MKWFGYAWAVLTSFVTLLIAIIVVAAFDTKFESVVVSLLILIYVGVRTVGQNMGFIAVEEQKTARNRFLMLMKALGDTQFETPEQKEAIENAVNETDVAMVKGYIHATSLLLLFFVGLAGLVRGLGN